MKLLRHHLHQNQHLWLLPLIVIGLLLISTALPFVASPMLQPQPELVRFVVDIKQNGRTHIP